MSERSRGHCYASSQLEPIVVDVPAVLHVLGWVRDAAIAVMVCMLIYIRGGDCNVYTKK